MVATTITLNLGNTESLDVFDTVTHMAFGSGTTMPAETDTSLSSEQLRVSVFDVDKDAINNTYTFSGRVPITELNSVTINELGLFDASSSGNMACRIVLNTGLTKTSDEELIFIIIIKIDTING